MISLSLTFWLKCVDLVSFFISFPLNIIFLTYLGPHCWTGIGEKFSCFCQKMVIWPCTHHWVSFFVTQILNLWNELVTVGKGVWNRWFLHGLTYHFCAKDLHMWILSPGFEALVDIFNQIFHKYLKTTLQNCAEGLSCSSLWLWIMPPVTQKDT